MSVANLQQQLFRANRNYRALARDSMLKAEAKYLPAVNVLSQQVPSVGSHEEYNWGDAVPRMAEFKGTRNMAALGVDGFVLENKEYDNGVWIRKKDLADDRLGIYNDRIRSLARMGVLLKLTLLRDLINNGFTTGLAYDGLSFFNNSHTLADSTSTNDNLITGALSLTNARAADEQLGQIKDSQGEQMGLSATHVIGDPSIRWTVIEVCRQSVLSTGEENVSVGWQPLIIPGLTAGYWAVADLSLEVKPFVLQEREALSFTMVMDPEDPDVFNRKLYKFGADWRGRAGYAYYELMVGSTG